jgi:hypothetical protein
MTEFDTTLLTAYLDDELSAEERQLVEATLATRADLAEELQALSAIRSLVRRSMTTLPKIDVSDRVSHSLLPDDRSTGVPSPVPFRVLGNAPKALPVPLSHRRSFQLFIAFGLAACLMLLVGLPKLWDLSEIMVSKSMTGDRAAPTRDVTEETPASPPSDAWQDSAALPALANEIDNENFSRVAGEESSARKTSDALLRDQDSEIAAEGTLSSQSAAMTEAQPESIRQRTTEQASSMELKSAESTDGVEARESVIAGTTGADQNAAPLQTLTRDSLADQNQSASNRNTDTETTKSASPRSTAMPNPGMGGMGGGYLDGRSAGGLFGTTDSESVQTEPKAETPTETATESFFLLAPSSSDTNVYLPGWEPNDRSDPDQGRPLPAKAMRDESLRRQMTLNSQPAIADASQPADFSSIPSSDASFIRVSPSAIRELGIEPGQRTASEFQLHLPSQLAMQLERRSKSDRSISFRGRPPRLLAPEMLQSAPIVIRAILVP